MSINESSAAEHLQLLKEVAAAGEDPRSLKWAAMRVRVDGTLAQVNVLKRIEDRAAATHDRAKGTKTPARKNAAGQAFDRAKGIDL